MKYLGVNRFLSFSLGDEEYAVHLLKVKEVIAVPETTPIPFSAPYFLGIMNLRGQVTSVIDMRTKFGMKKVPYGEEHAVLIIDLNHVFMGVADISEPPKLIESGSGPYITGVARRESKLILLIDIAKALNVEDLTIITDAKVAA
jgi:purine-binding chemotaxis protein CheW